jgi:hypothetical protein
MQLVLELSTALELHMVQGLERYVALLLTRLEFLIHRLYQNRRNRYYRVEYEQKRSRSRCH